MAEDTGFSPSDRPSSPPPWVTPSLAISACPQLDRSVSTASSVSSVSGRSTSSRLSDGGGRKRGYMRPQATAFADSARNRESVMSLGSIAHLQYYFARTGLLDGKGGVLAKARKASDNTAGSDTTTQGMGNALAYLSTDTTDGASGIVLDETANGEGLVESPVDQYDSASNWEEEPMMLPPTVSTYNHRPAYVPPPPDMLVLRRELREALDDARKVLKEVEKGEEPVTSVRHSAPPSTDTSGVGQESQGWYEIQGIHFLDIITLAIRAAKNYYTAHEQPQRLYSIQPEREIRGALFQVLEVLKRMATRNFSGGIRKSERESIMVWTLDIDKLIDTEEMMEREEDAEREKWSWREGDWNGREREREFLFLKSFDHSPDELPTWTDPTSATSLPTPFLGLLQNGLRLVLLHNQLVRKSRRQFEEIKVYHTDTAKPYRCADNLRYWIKAAELRWEIHLDVDVMGVVHGTDDAAWKKFDEALLKWCKGVREELTAEWKEQRKASQAKMPTLRIDDDLPERGAEGITT